MAETYELSLKNLQKTFGDGDQIVEVFHDISLDIRKNEFMCIIGPSGCGKTTLIRIIAGLLEPSKGEVFINGAKSAGPSSGKGVVFQADAVFPWMDVKKNVGFGLRVQKIPAARQKEIIARYIDLVGLKGFENYLPKQLSGGMRKRVDLARVYASNPAVMLMDEPFGALDAQTKSKMQEELLRIWEQERKTVLFITHDIDEAIFLSNRVAILSERPSVIKYVIDVDLPRPRTETMKMSEEFQKIKRDVWAKFNEKTTSQAS